MLFPDSERVIYAKNPLVEVVCQLRFPTILRIESELPATFQDKIRASYPTFKDNTRPELQVSLSEELAKLTGGAVPPTLRAGGPAYDFISADEQWKVGLTRDFLALSTPSYKRWEDFKEHLDAPLKSLVEVYAPDSFIRIGLRYRDLIRRSVLELHDTPWSALLEGHIAGELASAHVADRIDGISKQVHLQLPDGSGQVLIQHGLVMFKPTDEPSEVEICYLIDSDISITARKEVTDAIQILDAFNKESRRLFRWCITDRLHRAMEPRPI
jgi:uncharacterized protein (TIGR04255 family)